MYARSSGLFLLLALILRSQETSAEDASPVIRYEFKEKSNVTCMIMEFSATIVHTTDELDKESPIPNFTPFVYGEIDGDNSTMCGSKVNRIKIDFNLNKNNQTTNYTSGTLFLEFRNNSNVASLEEVSVSFEKNKTSPFSLRKNDTLVFSVSNTYHCESGIDITLNHASNVRRNVTLKLRSMRFNVFRDHSGTEFDADTVCSADVKSDKTVPIIVSIVLAGMVVIILVGYIIIRRREDRSAYQSV